MADERSVIVKDARLCPREGLLRDRLVLVGEDRERAVQPSQRLEIARMAVELVYAFEQRQSTS